MYAKLGPQGVPEVSALCSDSAREGGSGVGKIDYEARAKGGLQEGDDGASMALGRYVLR